MPRQKHCFPLGYGMATNPLETRKTINKELSKYLWHNHESNKRLDFWPKVINVTPTLHHYKTFLKKDCIFTNDV
jgi:hypothetical protein